MNQNDVKLLRRFLINDKVDKILEVLIKKFEGKDVEVLNQVILLYADYNNIQEKNNRRWIMKK